MKIISGFFSAVLVFPFFIYGNGNYEPCEDPNYVRIGNLDFKRISKSDSDTYALLDSLCGANRDSLYNSDLKSNRVTNKTRKDPTIGYVGIGFGALVFLGGVLLNSAGAESARHCKEQGEDQMMGPFLCDLEVGLSYPFIGFGLVITALGIYTVSQSFDNSGSGIPSETHGEN